MAKALFYRTKITTSRYKNVVAFVIAIFFLISLTNAQNKKLVFSSITDTSTINVCKDTTSFKIAKGNLDGEVSYKATDSIVYDAKNKQFYLYNNGRIKYQDLEVEANYVIYNMDSSVIQANNLASLQTDSSNYSTFKQGDQTVSFDTMQYNFKSQRALVQNAHNKYDDGYIISKQTKRNKDNSIYGLNNIYTTCSLDEPHFGIYSKKIKVIPGVMGISGPAQFVIEGIPTPLYLPFGIFPLNKGVHTGFILPTQTFNASLGFGLVGGGYYFPINDNIHATVLADIYSYGTYNIGVTSDYIKRYRYGGSFSVKYSLNQIPSSTDATMISSNTFKINWSHRIDPKVLNGGSFTALVDIGSSNYNKINYVSSQSTNLYLQNQLNSSITYSKSWEGKPYNLTIGAIHNQDNLTRKFTITLPNLNFSISGIQPFENKKNVGKKSWYEKIRFNYNMDAKNTYSFYDTAFSTKDINFRNMNNGVQHTASLASDYKFLKYFNFSVSANYNEYWNTKKSFKYYDATAEGVDTIKQYGFFTSRYYNVNAGISTTIFGTKRFKHGYIRGIRHTLTPNVGFSYHPDFGTGIYSYYYATFLDKYYTQRRISYFDGDLYAGPPDGKSGAINFSLANVLQLKVRNKKDTLNATKKVNIFDALSLGTSYNMAVDSFRWSPVSINLSSKVFNKITLSGGANFSPYAWNYTSNRRLQTLLVNTNGKLARFTDARMSLGADFTSKDTSTNKNGIAKAITDVIRIPWKFTVSISSTAQKIESTYSFKDSTIYSIGSVFGGSIELTPKWSVNAKSGYDFIAKKISYSTIGIKRDLHCWEMTFDFAPFSTSTGRYYAFTLHPKSNILKDLKITKKQYYTQ